MLGDTFVPPCFVDKKLSHKGASPKEHRDLRTDQKQGAICSA